MAEPKHADPATVPAALDEGLPIVAPPGASPALASSPFRELDPVHQTYEANPAEIAARIKTELKSNAEVVKRVGAKAD